jgi:hypothetical protein
MEQAGAQTEASCTTNEPVLAPRGAPCDTILLHLADQYAERRGSSPFRTALNGGSGAVWHTNAAAHHRFITGIPIPNEEGESHRPPLKSHLKAGEPRSVE